MRKSTIAAIAAASVMGFGMAGNALAADLSMGGFLDIRYNAMEDVDSATWTAFMSGNTGEEGNFTVDGELDFKAEQDGASVNIDLNLLNLLNPNGPTDADIGAAGATAAVDIEQANVMLPVPGMEDMLSLTAGIFNSPFGYEGQDATDINYALNGSLWGSVPSNMGGALFTVSPSDQLSINLGWINSRTDISGGLLADRSNDAVVTANFDVNENIGIGVGYLTDNSHFVTPDGLWGDQIDAYISTSDLVPGLGLAVEYLAGDPAAGTGALDNGTAIYADYDVTDMIGVAGRYEMVSYEGNVDMDTGSLAVNLSMSDNCVIRADYSEYKIDNGPSAQDVTIQMVHSF